MIGDLRTLNDIIQPQETDLEELEDRVRWHRAVGLAELYDVDEAVSRFFRYLWTVADKWRILAFYSRRNQLSGGNDQERRVQVSYRELALPLDQQP